MEHSLLLRSKWAKSPLDYVASKYNLLDWLMPLIPTDCNLYVEGCVGCSPIWANRDRAKMEVINDKYTAITNYYRVMQDEDDWLKLRDMINESIQSPEMFAFYLERLKQIDLNPPMTNREVQKHDVLYAYYWIYTNALSLFSRGQVMRVTNRKEMAGFMKELFNVPKKFGSLHDRLKFVYIDNRDVIEMCEYWDREDAIFYIDPPYPGTADCFRINFTEQDHINLLEFVVHMRARVYISSYPNKMYDSYLKTKHLHALKGQGMHQNIKVEALYCHAGV